MAGDPIPAVAEAEATGETAAIFADIRAVYGVGVVNLIWRHLATIPDALPWAWRAIRPLYVDGTVAGAAQTFRAGLTLPILPSVPPEVFASFGLAPDALASVRAVLAAYDHTNSMALIALTAVSASADGISPLPPRAGAGGREQNPTISLPPLPSLDAMPSHVAALVVRLNLFGTDAAAPILASMYRHLSYWPPYLGLVWSALAPMQASRALHAAIADTARQARATAAGIGTAAGPSPPGAREAIAPFIGDVLPKMVAICGMLHAMTTAPDA
jgi:hypothetical protein